MKISKKEVAKRQLVTAVNLYAKDCDIISIHNLTSAAYQIACDIEKWKNYQEMIGDLNFQSWSFLKNDQKERELENIIYKEAISKKPRVKKIISEIRKVFSKESEDLLDRFISACEEDLPKIIEEMKKPLNLIERQVDYLIKNEIFSEKGRAFGALRAGYNFLKHAEGDPDGMHEYKVDLIEFALFITCDYYSEVFEDFPLIFSRYTLWYKLNNPSLFTSDQDKFILREAKKYNISVDNRINFFEAGLSE